MAERMLMVQMSKFFMNTEGMSWGVTLCVGKLNNMGDTRHVFHDIT